MGYINLSVYTQLTQFIEQTLRATFQLDEPMKTSVFIIANRGPIRKRTYLSC